MAAEGLDQESAGVAFLVPRDIFRRADRDDMAARGILFEDAPDPREGVAPAPAATLEELARGGVRREAGLGHAQARAAVLGRDEELGLEVRLEGQRAGGAGAEEAELDDEAADRVTVTVTIDDPVEDVSATGTVEAQTQP